MAAGGEVIKELLVALGVDADTGAALDFSAAIELAEMAMKAAAIAAAALAAALVGAVSATVEAGSAATDGAARTGLSTQAYQELAYAAEQCGVPMELLEASLGKVSAMAGKAANGDEAAAKAFEALGISVTDANGKVKSSEQLFNETTAALAAIEDPAKRAAAAQALYGESAAKLMPLLSQGTEGIEAMRAEAELLGIVLSDEDVAAADAFGDSMDMLKGVVRGLAFDIGTALLPFLQRLVDGFKEWYLANRELIGKGLTVLSTLLGAVFRVIGTVADVIDSVVESTIGWDNVFKVVTVAVGFLATALTGLAIALGTVVAIVGAIISGVGIFLGLVSGMLPLVIAIAGAFATAAAAVAGVVLVIEDLYTYLQGGDSLIGRFVDQWRNSEGVLGSVVRLFDALVLLGRTLFAAFAPIGDAGSSAFAKLLPPLERFVNFITVNLMAALNAIAPYIDKLAAGIGMITGGVASLSGASVPSAAAGSEGAAGAASSSFGAPGVGVGASTAVGAPVSPTAGAAGGAPATSATMANTYQISGVGLTEEQVKALIRDFADQDTRALTDLSAGAAA
jgi:hypothetical protein